MFNKIDYIYKQGNGPTVVTLHGWGLNKNAFKKVVQCLNDNQSFLMLDFFGFGNSSMPEEYYDTYEYAYQVFLLIKKLGIKNIMLVGHSFGGRVAIVLSSVFGLNINGMILTSSAGLNKFSIIKYIKISFYKFKKFLVKINFLNQKFLLNSGSRDYKNLNITMRKVFVKVVNQNLFFLLKKIHIKFVKLVWDKADKETPYWMCKMFNRHILNSNILTYQTGGHFTYIKNYKKFAFLINNILECDFANNVNNC